jgi:gas vesicle protein
MADRGDRVRGPGGDTFVMGLLAGTVLGVGLGMLFAPKTGSEVRRHLAGRARAFRNQAQERFGKGSKRAPDWAEPTRSAVDERLDRPKEASATARLAVSRGIEDAEEYVRDVTVSGTGSGASADVASTKDSPGKGVSSS